MKLSGLNAIITGANRGFGFEVAKKFVEEGASIVICGRDTDHVKRAVDSLQILSSSQQTIIGLPLDVSKEENVKKLIDADHNGKITKSDPITERNIKYWDFKSDSDFIFVEMDAETGWITMWRGDFVDLQSVIII